jgi:uncharacterized protein YbjT (DUF2867 family)
MPTKKTILVTGATGAQGGSVAQALLQSGQYQVRVLTRRPQSDKAVALQESGAILYTGDFSDKESLKTAVNGCYGVFGLTNFWEHFEKEYDLGINLIDAAAAAGVQHFVLHTLPDYNALSGGQFPVPHCDMKAALKRYTKQKGIPATFLEVAFYYENFLTFFPPTPDQFGNYQFGFPQGQTKLAMVSVADVGGIVNGIIAEPEAFIGRTVGAVGADGTCDEYAAAMTRILGLPVHYNYIPRDLYASFGFPGAVELANMFEVQRLYIPNRQREQEESYRLNPGMQTFESWLMKNKEALLARMRPAAVEDLVY